MSKQCMNCGREISGVGNNKIFCDGCFHLIASFLRGIQSEDAPATLIFERNLPKLRESGINYDTERYIEKCCRRYDVKRGRVPVRTTPPPPQNERPSGRSELGFTSAADPFSGGGQQSADGARDRFAGTDRFTPPAGFDPFAGSYDAGNGGDADGNNDNGSSGNIGSSGNSGNNNYDEDYDVIPALSPDRKRDGVRARRSDTEYTEADNYGGIGSDDGKDDGEDDGEGENGTMMFDPVRQNGNDDSGDSGDTAMFAVPPVGNDSGSGGFGGAAPVPENTEYGVGGYGGYNDYNGDNGYNGYNGGYGNGDGGFYGGDDDGSDGGDGNGGNGGNGGKGRDIEGSRLLLVLAAAVAAAIIFVVLIANNFVGKKEEIPGGYDDETTDDASGGLPGHLPGGTEPSDTGDETQNVDTSEHDHVWEEATCVSPRKCKICGVTEGAPLGHDWGEGASCDLPATCQRCGVSTGAALGHDWGDPVFAWSNGNRTCTATFTCKRNAEHTENATAAVTTRNTGATCETAGSMVYTATVVLGDKSYKDEISVPSTTPLGHSWGSPVYTWSDDGSSCTLTLTCTRNASHKKDTAMTVTTKGTPATCEAAGSAEFTASVSVDGVSYSDKKEITSNALGHAWGAPVFTWTDDGKCTASVTCTHDAAHKHNLSITVTGPENVTEASCTEAGSATYTATVTAAENSGYISADATDKKTVTTPAKGHDFKENEITCSVCGADRPGLDKAVGTAYKDPNADYTVTVTSISHGDGKYTVSYALERSADTTEAFLEGKLFLVTKSGKLIAAEVDPPYVDDFDANTPKVEHTATFTLSDGDEPLFLEYHSAYISYGAKSQLYTDSPEKALYWKLS